MYLLILILVPFLYLFNSYLALLGLLIAIVVMYVNRTRPSKPRAQGSEAEVAYKAGYQD